MTDQKMDARLHAAGERWRAANTATADVPDETDGALEILPAPKRHSQRWISAASAAVLAVALVIGGVLIATNRGDGHGPSTATSPEASALTGRIWTLSGDRGSTLSFHKGSVTVDAAGCDKYTVATTVDADHITLGKQIGKPVTCPAPAPGAYVDHLKRIVGILTGRLAWSVVGERLTLTKTDGSTIGTLVYTSAAAPNPTLVGTDWQLSKIGNSTKVAGHASLTISGEQKLSGNDGCNSVSGDVTVRSGTIAFGQIGNTLMNCSAPDITATVSVVDAMLSGTVRYSIEGGELTLTKTGLRTLTYRAAKADVPVTDPAELTGPDWTLTGLGHASGNSASGNSAVSLSRVIFDAHGGFTVQHRCYTDKGKADLATGGATLTDVTLKLAVPCASNAESKDGQTENDLVDSVLTGTVTWSIMGKELTVTKGGDTLTFGRTDASALVGATWTLTTIEKGTGPGAAASPASTRLSYRFEQNAVNDGQCEANAAAISTGRITFNPRWSVSFVSGCKDLDVAQRQFVYGKLLTGTVTWSITGDQLTITKDGVGALLFTRN